MPWKEQDVMDARKAFIREYLEGDMKSWEFWLNGNFILLTIFAV